MANALEELLKGIFGATAGAALGGIGGGIFGDPHAAERKQSMVDAQRKMGDLQRHLMDQRGRALQSAMGLFNPANAQMQRMYGGLGGGFSPGLHIPGQGGGYTPGPFSPKPPLTEPANPGGVGSKTPGYTPGTPGGGGGLAPGTGSGVTTGGAPAGDMDLPPGFGAPWSPVTMGSTGSVGVGGVGGVGGAPTSRFASAIFAPVNTGGRTYGATPTPTPLSPHPGLAGLFTAHPGAPRLY